MLRAAPGVFSARGEAFCAPGALSMLRGAPRVFSARGKHSVLPERSPCSAVLPEHFPCSAVLPERSQKIPNTALSPRAQGGAPDAESVLNFTVFLMFGRSFGKMFLRSACVAC